MAALICKQRVPVPGSSMMKWCGLDAELTELGPRCYHHSPPPERNHPNPQRTRAIIEAKRLSLDRQERHDLAEHVVGHVGSWSTLSEEDGRRLADALATYHIVQALITLRRSHPPRSRR